MRNIHHDSRLQQRIELNRLSKAIGKKKNPKKKKKISEIEIVQFLPSCVYCRKFQSFNFKRSKI